MHKHFQKRCSASAKKSARIHTGRNRTAYSAPSPIRRIVLVVIFSTIAIVAITVICIFAFNTENMTKRRLADLATTYYEDYFYEGSVKSLASSEADTAAAFEKYEVHGFSRVPLRQLLLYDDGKNADLKEFFDSVCDENETYVQFFPYSPYGVEDYRVEYNYACNF